jgi:hypothetical protein
MASIRYDGMCSLINLLASCRPSHAKWVYTLKIGLIGTK